MLTIYTIHHVRSTRKGVILGTSDDLVDPALRAHFRTQTRDLVVPASGLIGTGGISAVAYTSTMRRQKETCEMLFSGTSIPIVVDERLRQIDNGPQYTGMNFDLGKRDYLNFIDKPFPQGESFRDFFAHICRGMSLEAAITDNANISGPFTYR
jgi:broad specificity phosphatase PhoE